MSLSRLLELPLDFFGEVTVPFSYSELAHLICEMGMISPSSEYCEKERDRRRGILGLWKVVDEGQLLYLKSF